METYNLAIDDQNNEEVLAMNNIMNDVEDNNIITEQLLNGEQC